MHKHADFEVPGFGEFAEAPGAYRAYVQAALALGPAGYWRLGEASGEGAAVTDRTGAFPGTVQGAVSPASPGAIARQREPAASFAGGRVEVDPSVVGSYAPGDAMTLIAWIKADPQAELRYFLSLGNHSSGTPRIALGVFADGRTLFYRRDDRGANVYPFGGAALDGTWHMIAGVGEGPVSRLYVDGQWVGTRSAALGGATLDRTTIGSLTSGAAALIGRIDQPAVYAQALSAAQVLELYHLGRGRLVPAAEGAAGGVGLSQSPQAAWPDRGGTGLRATLEPGRGGSCLTHALAAPAAALHSRVMLGPITADPPEEPEDGPAPAGSMALMGGQDESGRAAWWVEYELDPATGTAALTARSAGSEAALSATVPALPRWHHVELGLEGAGGGATLRLDGKVADHLDAGFDAPPTAVAWVGAMDKSAGLAGALSLDEWAIGEAPIGPARPEPRSPYADDPTRWLVIYNTAHPDSAAWAEHYRAARGIPYANLLGLDLPTDETISAGSYQALRDAVETYLDANALRSRLVGLVLGYAVPGFIADASGLGPAAIGARLQRVSPDAPGLDNPLLGDGEGAEGEEEAPARPTVDDLRAAGQRLVARLDGPSLAAARALIDRADDLLARPLDAKAGGAYYLDAFPQPGPGTAGVTARWVDEARSLERQRRRLPLFPAPGIDLAGPGPWPRADFATVGGEAISVAWADATPPPGYFADDPGEGEGEGPAARRALAISLQVNGTPPPTLRGSGAQAQWAGAALAAGYAATVTASRVTSLSDSPHPRPLLAALGRGWTLGEAWGLCQPRRTGGFFLVGDPLGRLTFPKAGYDVLGPLDRLDAVDPARPLAALPATASALVIPPEARPAPGTRAVYAVSVLDDRGRAERSYPAASIAVDAQGRPTPAPPAPLWPDHPDWPTPRRGGSLVLQAEWGRSLKHTPLTGVRLQAQGPADPAVRVVAQPRLAPDASRVTVTLAPPVTGTRYRWSWRGQGPWVAGPWSAPTPAAPGASLALRAV